MDEKLQYMILDKVSLLEEYKKECEKPLNDLNKKIDLLNLEINKYELKFETIKELMERLKNINSSLTNQLIADRNDTKSELEKLIHERDEKSEAFEIKQKDNLQTINIIEEYIKELENTEGYKRPIW